MSERSAAGTSDPRPERSAATRYLRWAVAWCGFVWLEVLVSGSVLVDARLFATLTELWDGSVWIVWIQVLLGSALLGMTWLGSLGLVRRRTKAGTERWPSWATPLAVGATLAWLGYVLVLRSPWLVGPIDPNARATLWASRLSRTDLGGPWVAFAVALGLGMLIAQAAFGLFRALDMAGFLAQRRRRAVWHTGLWLLCTLLYAVAASTVVAFAVGKVPG